MPHGAKFFFQKEKIGGRMSLVGEKVIFGPHSSQRGGRGGKRGLTYQELVFEKHGDDEIKRKNNLTGKLSNCQSRGRCGKGRKTVK